MFLSSADFIFKINVFENCFRNTIRVLNSSNPDQSRRFVGPGPGCQAVFIGDIQTKSLSMCRGPFSFDPSPKQGV